MKKLFLVRHCSAHGQHKDSPLTSDGIRQAELLSDFFSKQNISVDKIISSPYLRAIDSIKPFADKMKIRVDINDYLKERILSEEPIDDWLDVLDQSFKDPEYSLPGGESANTAVTRANKVLESIYSNDNLTNTIIISHGNLIALLLKQYDVNFGFDKWRKLTNPDIYVININDTKHSIEHLWNA